MKISDGHANGTFIKQITGNSGERKRTGLAAVGPAFFPEEIAGAVKGREAVGLGAE